LNRAYFESLPRYGLPQYRRERGARMGRFVFPPSVLRRIRQTYSILTFIVGMEPGPDVHRARCRHVGGCWRDYKVRADGHGPLV
jgi:hypothetical protein